MLSMTEQKMIDQRTDKRGAAYFEPVSKGVVHAGMRLGFPVKQ